MHLINLIVIYLYKKYGVPLHNFFENWTRGISHLNIKTLYSDYNAGYFLYRFFFEKMTIRECTILSLSPILSISRDFSLRLYFSLNVFLSISKL